MGALTDIINFLFLFGIIPLIGGVYLGKIEVSAALDIGLLLVSTVWCFFILRAPWSLYFAARNARRQLLSEKKITEQVDPHFNENIAELYRWEVYLFIVALCSPFAGAGGLYVLKLLADAGEIVFLKDTIRPSTIGLIFLSSCLHPAMQAHSSLKMKFVTMAVKLPNEYSDNLHFNKSTPHFTSKVTSLDSSDSKDQVQVLQQTVTALQEQTASFMEEIDRINKINKVLAQEIKKLHTSETLFQTEIKELQKQQTVVSEELEKRNPIEKKE